jgi:hypothetical protein
MAGAMASQVLDRGAHAMVRCAARCAPQAIDRGSQADACGAATLLQKEKNNAADAERSMLNITGFIFTEAWWPSRRFTSGEFGSLAIASWRR